MSGVPYYADDWLTVYHGDCKAVMAEMEPESVHCVVTSPPYWGLRDYGTATWVGGSDTCPHRVPATGSTQNKGNNNREGKPFDVACGVCGAIRQDSQLGLEPTPEEYVANLVAVFREVRRVLRADGTVWLNLGDSYNAYNGGAGPSSALSQTASEQRPRLESGYGLRTKGLKPKDLVGIPWRVAFALQADGWYLRSDIIWSKPNPMPESVADRPTKSHEYIFLLSKSPRYYFDADAIAEPLQDSSVARLSQPNVDQQEGSWRVPGKTNGPMRAVGGPSWQERKAAGATAGNISTRPDIYQNAVHGEGLSRDLGNGANRNARSVWSIATSPYRAKHFATFPRAIPERCIKAGSPVGGVILDPFAGSGTTGLAAQSLSRRAVLIDLSLDYLGQLMARNADIPLGLGA